MNDYEITFLSQSDVRQASGFDMNQAIHVMERVFALHDSGDYVLPNKTVLRWGDNESETVIGRINSMPGYIGGEFNACGIKWISSSPQNPFKRGLPRAAGLIVLNDPETLLPIAVMDGTLISAMRTGANSGVAAKYLARPNSRVLGLIGAGVQNRTQYMSLSTVLPHLETVKVYDVDVSRAQRFVKEMSTMKPMTFEVVPNAEEAVRESDVFVTATVTKNPIVKAEWIREGSLYVHVGSNECHFEVIEQTDKIVVDDWTELKHRGVETISIMYQEGRFDENRIYAQLGEVVNGKKMGRENEHEKIYFNSVGLGIEDVALAKEVLSYARIHKIGKKINLWDAAVFV
ncbi:hypothetical protein LLE49_27885 [Alicyclobacillus tolerans]|uniref:hypothetical protein n=1 Tax=Alicyclobacillus tolerans TaxID=90970 RepID=UPI001F36FF8A|nr:hypothetical protein [Alicyclobacillus tolerans]MCF8568544.1 hypothetical protein [Alicyclobacillus tolerans]